MAPVEESWPAPSSLDGVKSRKKAIFKADKVSVKEGEADGSVNWTVTIAVNLESRIAAVGEAGRAVVALLLGELPAASGAPARHSSLLVAHLGPHLAGPTATADEHAAAVAKELKKKPHVVVLQEAVAQGGVGWATTLRNILRGQAISAFKGAVVVACDQEATFAVRRVCLEQWGATSRNEVVQHDMSGRQLQIIEDALNTLSNEPSASSGKGRRGKKQAAAESNTGGLIEEARALAEYWFEEDLVEVARAKGWTVALLTEDVPDGAGNLRGFLAYRFVQADGGRELQIERLGIPKAHCKRGFGSVMMRWLIAEAARMPTSECSMLTTDALSNVVRFYKSQGFTENPNRQQKHKEDEDPNIFMELPNASLVMHNGATSA